jgi:hypothetical protein
MLPHEACLPVSFSKPLDSSKDGTMPPLEDCSPVSYCSRIETIQENTMPPLEDCYPVLEKLESRIDELASTPKSCNPLDKNTPIEVRNASEFRNREEFSNKKGTSDRSDEEHDHKEKEERKKWQEEQNSLMAEVDTLKASKAELEQNAIELEQELQFLRMHYQDSMNYFMSYQYQIQYLPPWCNLRMLHMEYHQRELMDKVEFLNKELEYERRCLDYYKQQCDEYSSDKKYMNQAYQDLKGKYFEERRSKDRLVGTNGRRLDELEGFEDLKRGGYGSA